MVWLSVQETAHELRISPSQVSRNETRLMELGVLAFKDSANYRRLGRRESGGDRRILFAYGIDLAPAAALLPRLTILAEDRSRAREEWLALKSEVAATRRGVASTLIIAIRDGRIPGAAAERIQDALQAIPGRVRATEPAESLRKRLVELKRLDADLTALVTGVTPSGSAECGETVERAEVAEAREYPKKSENSAVGPSDMRARNGANAAPASHPCVTHTRYNTKGDYIR